MEKEIQSLRDLCYSFATHLLEGRRWSHLEGSISEPSSLIPPNWIDIRNRFGYNELNEMVGLITR